jgi:hypothetical protein
MPCGIAGQLRSKLLAAIVGAAAACLMGATAQAAPEDPAMPQLVSDQHAIVNGHRIQPRRGTADADHLSPDDTRTVEGLYQELMTTGANGAASKGR